MLASRFTTKRTTRETAAGPVVTGFAGATLAAEPDVTPNADLPSHGRDSGVSDSGSPGAGPATLRAIFQKCGYETGALPSMPGQPLVKLQYLLKTRVKIRQWLFNLLLKRTPLCARPPNDFWIS
jgi:hypothetical protein